ncbi:MAG: hypothetical protein C0505_06890 [Leptothrix sp. (in: Bacteria)]|nr:hypothetical protein [Leptothrix sp. (in: b-proteobacteria)]
MTTGWGDTVVLEEGTIVEVLSARGGSVEVLDGEYRGRTGTVPPETLEDIETISGSSDLVRQWVEWQCGDLSTNFQRAFQQELEKCLLTRGTLLLRAMNHALKVKQVDAGQQPITINGDAASAKAKFERDPASNCVLLFRFYSGDGETLLPPCLQKPVHGRVEPSQPARLPQERVDNPLAMLRGKQMGNLKGQGSGSASASRQAAHAHQEGHQARSPFVSCGYHLPRLLRTPSYKVRVIMFGHSGGEPLAGYEQASHLGVFLVPKSRLGEVIWKTGEMACLEREVTFNGEGLIGHELFTMRNPFHSSSPHKQSQPESSTLAYF